MSDRAAAVLLVAALAIIAVIGIVWADAPPTCPPPDYDVNRVVKMHEESRQCEATLEECKDTVKICAGLLKQALE
jgi:hypothetical protein